MASVLLGDRRAGLAGMLAVVAVAVVTMFVGTLSVRTVIVQLLHRSARLRSAQSELYGVLLARSDEASYAHALLVSGDRRYARRLTVASAAMHVGVSRLTADLVALNMPRSVAAVRSLDADVVAWDRLVSAGLRGRVPTHADERAEMALRRRIRSDGVEIERRLNADSADAERRTELDADRTLALAALASVLVVAFALVAIRHRAAYAAERRVTEALRRAFVPTALPATAAVRIDARSLPVAQNAQLGGDWCDAYELPDKRIFFSIGDVAGHGLAAAVGMSRARQSLLAAALSQTDPSVVLENVNAVLLVQRADMVTAICGYVEPETRSVAYACAGHPPPIAAEHGAVRLLPYGDIPLAVDACPDYTTQSLQLCEGGSLIFYTDGVLEYEHDPIAGERQLLETVRDLAGTPSAASAEDLLYLLVPNRSPSDDASVMIIAFSPYDAG